METKSTLSRRNVLKGLGACIALPFLESIVPGSVFARPARLAPKRAAFLFMPNGVHPARWTPEGVGSSFQLSPILQPLGGLRDDILVLTELVNRNSFTNSEGHYTKTANFLTSMPIQKTTGANVDSGGISVDQIMANRLRNETLYPSLVYGIDRITTGVDKNVGFTRLYGSSISWVAPTRPSAKEIDPRMAFDRLFRGLVPEKPARQENPFNKSVLDLVQEDAKSLQGSLGVEDQNKLQEYLEAVRSVERRIEDREKTEEFKDHITPDIRKEIVGLDSRIDEFVEYRTGMDVTEKTRLMLDIMVLAFWSDASRVATFMFGNSVSNRNFSFLDGVSGNHHSISHHKRDPRQLAQYERINRWHVEQYAYLLSRMKSIKEGDGTLLDNSMVMFGSGLRDGDAHSPRNLPIVLGGRGGGALKTGRHIQFEESTPLANMYLSLLHVMGVEASSFGDSSGELTQILA